MTGRILFGGVAALLICIFLSPKFIAYLRRREFGQQIRAEGPAAHQRKAGTPTAGGLIIFIAGHRAVPDPHRMGMEVGRRARGRARVRRAGIRRRLHEALQAALARAKRTHEADRHDRDLARAVVRRAPRGGPAADCCACGSLTTRSILGRSTRL